MTGYPALLALLFTPTLALQPKTSGSEVAVHVMDQTGASIPAASITVLTPQGGSMLSAQTDADGNADLELPNGEFVAVIESRGFCPQKRTLKIATQPQAIKVELRVDSCPGPCQVACIAPNSGAATGHPPASVATHSVLYPVVNLIVEELTGVRIPLARIEIRGENDERVQELFADKFGEATVSLVPGASAIRVGAPGFETWQIRMDSAPVADQSTRVVLKPGRIQNSPLVNDNTQRPQVEAYVPLIELSSVPRELLKLPPRKLHVRFRH